MPIKRRLFELGIREDVEEWMRRIYTFLDSNKDQAFTKEELVLRVRDASLVGFLTTGGGGGAGGGGGSGGGGGVTPDVAALFVEALFRLVSLNIVNEREVSGTLYYATGRYSFDEIL